MAKFQPSVDKITGASTKGPDAIADAKNKSAEGGDIASPPPAKEEKTGFVVFCMVDARVPFNREITFEPFKWYELSHPLHVAAAKNQATRFGAGIVLTKPGQPKPQGM